MIHWIWSGRRNYESEVGSDGREHHPHCRRSSCPTLQPSNPPNRKSETRTQTGIRTPKPPSPLKDITYVAPFPRSASSHPTNAHDSQHPSRPPGFGKPKTHSRNLRRHLKNDTTPNPNLPHPPPPKASSSTNLLPLSSKPHPPPHKSTANGRTKTQADGPGVDVASTLINTFAGTVTTALLMVVPRYNEISPMVWMVPLLLLNLLCLLYLRKRDLPSFKRHIPFDGAALCRCLARIECGALVCACGGSSSL